MAEEPENYIFFRTTRDIEAAHIKQKTAVIWNSQTATILEEDLTRMATLKDMGIASIILAYNDRFRTGSKPRYEKQGKGHSNRNRFLPYDRTEFG
jgi:membrane dipeptidase